MSRYNGYDWNDYSQQQQQQQQQSQQSQQQNQSNNFTYTYPSQANPSGPSGHASIPARPTAYPSNSSQSAAPSSNAYGGDWYQPQRNVTTTESRAAETLNALSNQEGQQSYPSYPAPSSQTWNARPRETSASQPQSHSTYSTTNHYASQSNYSQPFTQTRQTSQPSVNPTSSATFPGTSGIYTQSRTNLDSSCDQYRRAPQNTQHSSDRPSPAPQTQSQQRATATRPSASPQFNTAAARPTTSHVHGANMARMRTHTLAPTAMAEQARNLPINPASAADVGPSTIDPSRVYDPWPEQQRQALKAAEERKQREAEQARKKAEEAKVMEAAAAQVRENQAALQAAADEQERRKGIEQAKLLSARAASDSASKKSDAIEAEMRAMFENMRQFNQKDPQLLARLWEEERNNHVNSSPTPTSGPPNGVSSDHSQVAESATPTQTDRNAKVALDSATKRKGGRPKGSKNKPKNAVEGTGVLKPAGEQTTVDAGAVQEPASAPLLSPMIVQPPAPMTAPPSASAAPPKATAPAWPAGRKEKLSEIGAKWLNGRSENRNKHITAKALQDLLSGNPSYLNLCSSIEGMGLHVDRSAFAKTLLTAVPDLNKPSSNVATPAAPLQAEAESVVRTSAVDLDAYRRPEPPSPDPITENIVKSVIGNRSQGPPGMVVFARPRTVNGKPLTKSEAARKRNIQEVFDLTGADSDEDQPPAAKVRYAGPNGLTPPQTSQLQEHTAVNHMDQQGPPPSMQNRNPRLLALNGKVLVESMKRSNVLRRNGYDPRTIARDILLATGRHPEMRPLNSHLMEMQFLLADHSAGVDLHKYDLSTIRWDSIDPGDALYSSDDSRADADSEADDESDAPAIKARTMRRIETLNNDGTLTVTTVPAVTTLKGMGGVAAKRGRRGLDRRRDQFPGSINAAGSQAPQRGRPPGRSERPGANTSTAASPTESPAPVGYTAFRTQQYDENGQPIKRLGRPVGWRKAIHGKGAQGLGAGSPSSLNAASNKKNQLRRPKDDVVNPADSLAEPEYNVWPCGWDDCHAELHNLDTLRKHVVKVHGAAVNSRWACAWEGCHASDHKVKSEGRSSLERANFGMMAKWMGHMETKHLLPLARALGDGPRSGLSDAYDSEASQQAYLSDTATGRIVTPRATLLSDLHEEEEAIQAMDLAPVLRRGMPRVDRELSHQQHEDEQKLQQLEARKLSLGPGLERGGARLANEARRKGFYDDEDFEGEVTEDDGPDWD